MSMLAEPKHKTKWSLNPRGDWWSKDESKWGQKILEKMGWSKGKGLGKDETGKVDPIKVVHRCSNKGLGFKDNDEGWKAHNDEYEALLQTLRQVNDDSSSDTRAHSSLERKSKKSKKRIHYHKFLRGKDLSRYSDKDMQCIFGKKDSKVSELGIFNTIPTGISETKKYGSFDVDANTSQNLDDDENSKSDEALDMGPLKTKKRQKNSDGDTDSPCNEDHKLEVIETETEITKRKKRYKKKKDKKKSYTAVNDRVTENVITDKKLEANGSQEFGILNNVTSNIDALRISSVDESENHPEKLKNTKSMKNKKVRFEGLDEDVQNPPQNSKRKLKHGKKAGYELMDCRVSKDTENVKSKKFKNDSSAMQGEGHHMPHEIERLDQANVLVEKQSKSKKRKKFEASGSFEDVESPLDEAVYHSNSVKLDSVHVGKSERSVDGKREDASTTQDFKSIKRKCKSKSSGDGSDSLSDNFNELSVDDKHGEIKSDFNCLESSSNVGDKKKTLEIEENRDCINQSPEEEKNRKPKKMYEMWKKQALECFQLAGTRREETLDDIIEQLDAFSEHPIVETSNWFSISGYPR